MNDRDRDNLNFLLSADEHVLRDWYSKMDQDDISYALELLHTASLELVDQAVELSAELSDCAEAREYLSKFRINS